MKNFKPQKLKIHWTHRRSRKIKSVGGIRDREADINYATRRMI